MANPRILLVEDDDDNLGLVTFLLQRHNYDVLTARNGKEAVRLAQEQLPDLIILDMNLPELDGWSAAKLLKGAPQTQSIPIIALTAQALPGDRRRALDAGCDGYIAKPMNVPLFAQEIEKFLKK
jgi:CheY-like chemotaxis protein